MSDLSVTSHMQKCFYFFVSLVDIICSVSQATNRLSSKIRDGVQLGHDRDRKVCDATQTINRVSGTMNSETFSDFPN